MKKSKVVAIVITLAIVFGMMPMNLSVVSAGMVEDGDKIIITGEVTMDDRLFIEGEKTLVLEEGCMLDAKQGIEVEEGDKLTIEGTGSLKATGTDGAAGIGISPYSSLGNIVINGGNIEAIGGAYERNGINYGGAGIGGYGRSTHDYVKGSITINGGKVHAVGGVKAEEYNNACGGAGIGGGNGQFCGEINITGGEVQAESGSCAAAIGAGNDAIMGINTSERINISGGTVIAKGNIGGSTWHNYIGETLDIHISGGNITASEIGGGSRGGVANITFDWTEEGKNTTRIEAQYYALSYKSAFNKPFVKENDPTEKVLVIDDLTKDSAKIAIVPYTKTSPSAKKANTIKVTAKKKTIKAKKLKKKSLKVKALKVKNAVGKVTFKKVKKGTTKKIYKKVKVTNKGILKFKKGKYKKKTYKIKVKITAAGNANYLAKTLTKTVKVKVK